MSELKRIQVGDFNIKDAITIEELKQNKDKFIIPIEKLFEDKHIVDLDDGKLQLFLNGVKLTKNLEDGLYRIYNNEKFVGIGIINNKLLKRDIIL